MDQSPNECPLNRCLCQFCSSEISNPTNSRQLLPRPAKGWTWRRKIVVDCRMIELLVALGNTLTQIYVYSLNQVFWCFVHMDDNHKVNTRLSTRRVNHHSSNLSTKLIWLFGSQRVTRASYCSACETALAVEAFGYLCPVPSCHDSLAKTPHEAPWVTPSAMADVSPVAFAMTKNCSMLQLWLCWQGMHVLCGLICVGFVLVKLLCKHGNMETFAPSETSWITASVWPLEPPGQNLRGKQLNN